MRVIEEIIRREGGYVDHPNDKGGPTKYGITLGTFSQWLGRLCTAKDVKEMTIDEARQIYKKMYVDDPGYSKIRDHHVLEMAVDMAVNHGIRNASKMLQECAGVPVDGVIGPVTLSRINAIPPKEFLKKLIARRAVFYARICKSNPSQVAFIEGWINRNNEFLEYV